MLSVKRLFSLLFIGVHLLSATEDQSLLRVSPLRIEQAAARFRSHDERLQMLRYSVYAAAAIGILGIMSHKAIAYKHIQQRLHTVETALAGISIQQGPAVTVAQGAVQQAVQSNEVGWMSSIFHASKNLLVGGVMWVTKDIIFTSMAKSFLGFVIDPVRKIFTSDVAIPVKSCWFIAEQYRVDVATNFAIVRKDTYEFVDALMALDRSVDQIRQLLGEMKLSRQGAAGTRSHASKGDAALLHCEGLIGAVELLIGHLDYMHAQEPESYGERLILASVGRSAREQIGAAADALVTAVLPLMVAEAVPSSELYSRCEQNATVLLEVTRTVLRPLMGHRLYRVNPWPLETVALEIIKNSLLHS